MPQATLLKSHQNHLFPRPMRDNIISAFSAASDKNMSLKYGDTKNSLNNRKDFLKGLGIDYRNLVCAKQMHAGNIKYVDLRDLGKGALSYDTAIDNIDALITDKRNVPLAIFTADCLSVFLYDSHKSAIGLVHAGWRSTKESISAKTIKLMQDKFNTSVEDLYVGFGPAIRKYCCEVKEDFKRSLSAAIFERTGHYYLDLVGENKRQILGLGVKESNISDLKICTSCQAKSFFSYRREGASCGRMISVMMLK